MSNHREALAARLAQEFGPFLAHSPHDPQRFYGTAADAILAEFDVFPRGDAATPVIGAVSGLWDAPHGQECCEERGPKGLMCTRTEGHEGTHVASNGDVILAVFEGGGDRG